MKQEQKEISEEEIGKIYKQLLEYHEERTARRKILFKFLRKNFKILERVDSYVYNKMRRSYGKDLSDSCLCFTAKSVAKKKKVCNGCLVDMVCECGNCKLGLKEK